MFKECVVIGAGISGIAVGRWLKDYKVDFMILEKSNDIAGLWRFREDDYGVMDFTHINVSKYNYCYSDHPFPEDSIDYPHHSEMYRYVKSYVEKHSLSENIKFETEVIQVAEMNSSDDLLKKFPDVDTSKKLWKIKTRDIKTNEETLIITHYLSIASGHHGVPLDIKFPGQETFTGDIIHSVKYKSASINKLNGKRVLVVGIGNSSVDVSVNLYNEGRCPKVVVSTRSGAWIIPNYINGFCTDLYACRAFLAFPYKITTIIMEEIIKFIYGNMSKYNLTPKMRALQSQPTVSPTLIHHIQRKQIQVKPNIKSIAGSEVTFEDGTKDKFDTIIMCTGYKIGIDFLHPDLKKKIFIDKNETQLRLFKQVFHPSIGNSLGFVGFAQPTSGGLLTISEIQARWFVYLMKGNVKLPSEAVMNETIHNDMDESLKRFHASSRHTIQQDPIIYNDQITEMFGAKPDYFKNILISWRLLISSCGPSQWRLNGPDQWSAATKEVKKVPVTFLMKALAALSFVVLSILFGQILFNPLLLTGLVLSPIAYIIYKKR